MVNTEETTVETNTETTNTVDIESLQTKLAEAEEKNKTLGDKIYKLKKETKNTEMPKEGLSIEDMTKFYEEKDKEKEFFKKSPDMIEYKDQIKEFTSKGYTLEHAEYAVREKNPDIVARQNTKNSNFTDGMSGGGKKSYSQEQLQKLPHAEKMQALRDINAGKAIETN